MKSKPFRDLLIVIAFCLLVSVIAVYQGQIRAALHLTEKVVSVEDPNSPLLKLLLVPDDFPDQFGWYWQRIGQSGDGASAALDGYYGFHKVHIYQHVGKFEQPPIRKIDAGVHFLGDLATLDGIYDLQAAGIADFHGTRCAFNLDDTVGCKVRVDRSKNTIEMDIDYGEPGNVDAMEKILNVVTAILEGKLKQ